ncbi:Putative sodium-coupled neutral amino acid transporter 7 [Sarcoptes scabiei]|uniref:Putative sodium-coupled neutral amino acid transporter 7 n=1 Tax=Sarcoptes scabiei TaxID=52283 RepID=A0A834R8F2_SARSC|nr:Putative sodium-coupled neutral amino acid transporter 7 [Sarcoptes scabiei]
MSNHLKRFFSIEPNSTGHSTLSSGSRKIFNAEKSNQQFPILSTTSSTLHSGSNSLLSNFYTSSPSSSSTTFRIPFKERNLTNQTIEPFETIQCSKSSISSRTTISTNETDYGSIRSYDVIDDSLINLSEIDNRNRGKITWIMASFLLINAALGAGLLNYPVAYDRLGGIVFATIIQIFAAILMITTILILIYCAELTGENSYHGVMREMCGRRVMQFSATSIAITCFGICVTFIIIIGDQFDRIFGTYIGSDFCRQWYFNRIFTMSATAIIATWPMCYFRRIDFLRHINVLGVLASIYIIFLNVYSYFKHTRINAHDGGGGDDDDDDGDDFVIRTSPASILEFIAALPVVFFAYQTHEIVIPVYDSMSTKSIKNFSKSFLSAMIVLLFLYCLAGSFGYLTFGSKVAPDIMLMYNARDPIVLAGIIALIIKMITTYPPVVFCGRDTIVRLLLNRNENQNLDDYLILENRSTIISNEQRYNIIITTVWNSVVLILAILIPNITIAIGFLGSLASCNVFIFPGLALLGVSKRLNKIREIGSKFEDPIEQQRNRTVQQDRNRFSNDNDRVRSLSFHNLFVQSALQLYALFIISMGVIMFVIILIQVYHDFNEPAASHGLFCDINTLLLKDST